MEGTLDASNKVVCVQTLPGVELGVVIVVVDTEVPGQLLEDVDPIVLLARILNHESKGLGDGVELTRDFVRSALELGSLWGNLIENSGWIDGDHVGGQKESGIDFRQPIAITTDQRADDSVDQLYEDFLGREDDFRPLEEHYHLLKAVSKQTYDDQIAV